MSAYKNFLIGVEELVWEAYEKGFTDADSVYAYVYMYESRVTRDYVNNVLQSIHEDN